MIMVSRAFLPSFEWIQDSFLLISCEEAEIDHEHSSFKASYVIDLDLDSKWVITISR
jgi:hypothetical protein